MYPVYWEDNPTRLNQTFRMSTPHTCRSRRPPCWRFPSAARYVLRDSGAIDTPSVPECSSRRVFQLSIQQSLAGEISTRTLLHHEQQFISSSCHTLWGPGQWSKSRHTDSRCTGKLYTRCYKALTSYLQAQTGSFILPDSCQPLLDLIPTKQTLDTLRPRLLPTDNPLA